MINYEKDRTRREAVEIQCANVSENETKTEVEEELFLRWLDKILSKMKFAGESRVSVMIVRAPGCCKTVSKFMVKDFTATVQPVGNRAPWEMNSNLDRLMISDKLVFRVELTFLGQQVRYAGMLNTLGHLKYRMIVLFFSSEILPPYWVELKWLICLQ